MHDEGLTMLNEHGSAFLLTVSDPVSFMDRFPSAGTEIGEALAPEDAIVALPIGQRCWALGFSAVVDVSALGALGDQASPL